MTAAELVQLLQCGRGLPGFYFFDPDSRSAFIPSAECLLDVPWPLEFIARYHPKHVFESRSSPPISELNKAVAQWEHRTRWKIFHSLQGDNNIPGSTWSSLEDRKLHRNFPCNHLLPTEWEQFFSLFRAQVFQKGCTIRSKLSNRRRSISNLNGVVRLGFKLLAESRWCLVSTDKDGGYALCDRAALQTMITASLDSHFYEETFVDDFKVQNIVEDFTGIVKWVEEHTQDSKLSRALLSSVRNGSRRFHSQILCTVKTHKPPGSVGLRIIHSSVRNMFVPAMRYISSLLRPHLDPLTHLVRDSDDLISQMSKVVVPPSAMMVKFDIKDFYMSGEHSTILSSVAKFFPEGMRTCLEELTALILHNQYVATAGDKTFYRVCTGAGMGLTFAGDLADTTFLDLVEQSWLLTDAVRTHYNLVCYYRFKDDGFFVINCSRKKRLEFANKLRQKAGCFKVKFEAVSNEEMAVLDVEFYKGCRWHHSGILDHRLFSKTTSQWTPLQPSSFHNPSIHKSWPLAQIERIRKKHSNNAEAKLAIQAFKDRYEHATGVTFPSVTTPAPRTNENTGCLPRFTLPFRAEWLEAGIRSIAESAWYESGVTKHAANPEFPGLQVSWMLSQHHLLDQIRKMNGGARGR